MDAGGPTRAPPARTRNSIGPPVACKGASAPSPTAHLQVIITTMTIPSRYPCPQLAASVRFAPHRCYPTSSTGLTWLVLSLAVPLVLLDAHRSSAETPTSPRIDYVVPLSRQPHETDPATIWYDDFNGQPRSYPEASGRLDPASGARGDR